MTTLPTYIVYELWLSLVLGSAWAGALAATAWLRLLGVL